MNLPTVAESWSSPNCAQWDKFAFLSSKINKLYVAMIGRESHNADLEDAMTETVKLPRKLSEEPMSPKPRRPSHEKVIEQLDRWANSRELQPPRLPETRTA